MTQPKRMQKRPATRQTARKATRQGARPDDRTTAKQTPRQASQLIKPVRSKPLDKAGIRYLRSLAHTLKPIVRLGQNGFTDAVSKELDGALEHHELVKVKLSVGEKTARLEQLDALCQASKAQCIQQIGHTATLYRRNEKKPLISIPK